MITYYPINQLIQWGGTYNPQYNSNGLAESAHKKLCRRKNCYITTSTIAQNRLIVPTAQQRAINAHVPYYYYYY